MKRERNMKNRSRGFTLLEVIITLIVASILGTILISYMGTVMTGSAQLPYRQVQVYEMNQVMDNITADYLSLVALYPSLDVLPDLERKIRLKTGNYGTYTPTTSWITYSQTNVAIPPVATDTPGATGASTGYLKVTIAPVTGGTGVTHTALFTR